MEENCSTDWYFTKNVLDFNKSLRQKARHKTHIQRGRPKGNSRNITFPNITIITLFKFPISNVTFFFFHRPLLIIAKLLITRQLNFINHLFYLYVIWIWLIICCKTKLKKKLFFLNILVLFTKYTLFAEIYNNFIWKKTFVLIFFLLKKLFYRKWKIYISFEKYFFIQKICIHSAKKNSGS